MDTKFRKLIPLLVLAAAVVMQCSENPANEDEADPAGAATKVEAGNTALENVIMNMPDVQSPEDLYTIDFSTANAAYKEAIALDPDNMDAQMGAAVTEIMTMMADPDIQSMEDEMSAFMDTSAMLSTISSSALGKTTLGMPSTVTAVTSPHAAVARTAVAMATAAATQDVNVSDFQAIITDELMPRLAYALERLDIIDDDAAFTFTVTPEMQGDASYDPVELDLTEVYLAEAGLNVLYAACNLMVAYSFDIDLTLDSTAVMDILGADGSFLGLKSDGTARMSTAKNAVLAAITKLDAGITYLKNETDDQDDDAIKIDPTGNEGPNASDLDNIQAELPNVEDLFDGTGYTVNEDWNGDGAATDLVVNLAGLFDTPVQNIKQLLPGYSVELVPETVGNADGTDSVTVYLPSKLVWDADTYAGWTFPDPTMSGLFPGLTTDTQFKTTFGIDLEADWAKEMPLFEESSEQSVAAK